MEVSFGVELGWRCPLGWSWDGDALWGGTGMEMSSRFGVEWETSLLDGAGLEMSFGAGLGWWYPPG